VAATYGAQFGSAGYSLTVSGQPADPYYWIAVAHSSLSGVWQAYGRTSFVDVPTVSLTIDRQAPGPAASRPTG
jgi:hypothetical protein